MQMPTERIARTVKHGLTASSLPSCCDKPGATQEMVGVVLFATNAPFTDAMAAFKEAFYRYNHAAGPRIAREAAVRQATRCMLMAAEHARHHGTASDANYVLMKAHFQARLIDLIVCISGSMSVTQSASHLDVRTG